MAEIDPNVIVGRRTRGIKVCVHLCDIPRSTNASKKVDYTSKEALEKAGLKDQDQKDDDDDDEEMKDWKTSQQLLGCMCHSPSSSHHIIRIRNRPLSFLSSLLLSFFVMVFVKR